MTHRLAEKTVATWHDLSNLKLGREALQFVSLFDDTSDVWAEEDIRLVEGMSTVTPLGGGPAPTHGNEKSYPGGVPGQIVPVGCGRCWSDQGRPPAQATGRRFLSFVGAGGSMHRQVREPPLDERAGHAADQAGQREQRDHSVAHPTDVRPQFAQF